MDIHKFVKYVHMTCNNFFSRHNVLTFFYLFPVRAAATILPTRTVRALGRLLSHIYALPLVAGERRKSLEESLSRAFRDKKTADEIKELSGCCIHNAISSYIDDLILPRIDNRSLMTSGKIEGMENLMTALSGQRGVILVSGHFSGNRVAKRFLRDKGYPILSVRNRYPSHLKANHTEMNYLSMKWHRLLDVVVADHVFTEDNGFGLEILRRLRENGLVSILFDALNSKHIIECPFLGSTRLFSADFLRVARLTHASVLPMLCIGNSSVFTIKFEKEVELDTHEDMATFLSINLRKIVKTMESHVLAYPTHWLFM